MKALTLALFLAASLFAADSADYRLPLEILKQDGELALCDGSSYFVFSQDGTFRSFPVGVSGRRLTGTWTSKETNPVFITATGKVGWANGIQPRDEYRKAVFVIYGGRSEPQPPNRLPNSGGVKNIYRGYFIIEEFTKIPKPE